MTYNSLDFLLLAVMAIGGFLAGIEYGAHRQRQRDADRFARFRREIIVLRNQIVVLEEQHQDALIALRNEIADLVADARSNARRDAA